MSQRSLSDLAVDLYDIEAVKFGDFTLKSGIQSPIYFDLRVIISFPHIMTEVSEILWQTVQKSLSTFALVCGVPYTALPLATLFSANHGVPMVMRRKETKSYGTKKVIEGRFKSGDVCLIIEDVVTSGSSVQETVEALSAEGIVVRDAIVLLDREQGGKERLKAAGITLHSAISMSNLLQWLLNAGKIDQSAVDGVITFLSENQLPVLVEDQCPTVITPFPLSSNEANKVLDYVSRAAMCENKMTKRLFGIMAEKKTNLSLAADVTESKKLLALADDIGPFICVLKTHIDELNDFTPAVVDQLKLLSEKHNFLIFEDRKFADIGQTVCHQYSGGLYKISRWADIVNAHSISGPGIIDSLKQVDSSKGCLLIGEMSSKGNLITETYTKETLKMANRNKDFVIGFISTKQISTDPRFIHFTPGVHLISSEDGKDQQYTSPHQVIVERRSDILIVGRGITESLDPAATAKLYQEAGHAAYLELLSSSS